MQNCPKVLGECVIKVPIVRADVIVYGIQSLLRAHGLSPINTIMHLNQYLIVALGVDIFLNSRVLARRYSGECLRLQGHEQIC